MSIHRALQDIVDQRVSQLVGLVMFSLGVNEVRINREQLVDIPQKLTLTVFNNMEDGSVTIKLTDRSKP